MAEETLSGRALNRALLARQMLLRREAVKLVPAIERVGGIQAQLARPPFIGLWSRLERFSRADLIRAAAKNEVVRATMMRATLHLMSRKHFVTFRPLLQPMLARIMGAVLKDRTSGVDLATLIPAARAYFDEEPRTFVELRAHLASRFPDVDERAMGYIVRTHLPLLQVPADGELWGYASQADFAVAETWLGEKLAKTDGAGDGEIDTTRLADLAWLYLSAFGPARPQDFQSWSFFEPAVARAAFDALRPKLVTFRDERRRELFDLPKAPRPGEDTDAPVRFLPEFDSVLLAHADRSRIIAEAHRPKIVTKNLLVPATFLVDGYIGGTWKVETKRNVATLAITPFDKLAKPQRAALEAEGEQLLAFVEPNAKPAIQFVAGGKQ